MDISMLLELNDLALENAKIFTKKRFIFDEINADIDQGSKHFTAILGSRGAGKTILLKQLNASSKDSFYISLDAFDGDLFEGLQELNQKLGVKLFFLDEVHFYSDFESVLKKVYDFLDVKIVFTSSVALALWDSAYDLSRRVVLKVMYPFSFREYLYFVRDISDNAVKLVDIFKNSYDPGWLKMFPYFLKYIEGGIMPFALNEPIFLEVLQNILNTVVYKDIARVSNFGMDELDKIAKLVVFIGKSKVDGINYTSISRNIGITKYKAEQYTDLLQKAFIIHRIFPKGTNVLKEPKILMALPYRLLYSDRESCLGGLREDFFVEAMKMIGKEIYYLKNTRGSKTPDFLIEHEGIKVICEVGGKGKGTQQFKGISIKEKIIFSDSIDSRGNRRPLMIVGCCS